ncbi:MAG: MATE family efflux transporter [Clostridiales bacterium]|nr:MATE family efflux transporter [Clostridiales bacterium]
MGRSHGSGDMTQGVIWRQLLSFFFPILLGTLFQQLYNTADAIVVGRFVGKEALASVGGSTAQIYNLLIGFFVGLSSGASVIISQFFGANDERGVHRALHTAMALSVAAGLVMTALGLIFAPGLLRLMNTPEDILEHSTDYLRIVFLAMVPAMIYNVGSGVLRALGDSRRPLMFLIASCLSNVALDIVFVIVFGMGVSGVAIATSLAQCLSAVLVLATLAGGHAGAKLVWREIRFDGRILRDTLRIGLPSGLQSVLYTVSNMIITSTINGFGTSTVAAWVSLGKVDGMFWMINNAFGIAIMTFVGQNYGARQYERIRKGLVTCAGMSTLAALAFSAFFFALHRQLFGLFTNDPEVLAIAAVMMGAITPWYFLFVPVEMISGALRGMGNTLIPTAITAIGVCLFRVMWMYVVVPGWHTVYAISISYPITWAITAAAFIVYYRFERKKLVVRAA